MSSSLILRNSRRNRKENGLFFSSLVISIVAFYIILALSKQDVMLFLARMESDAVNRLLELVPVFFGMTLAILFFLVFFASKYQLARRRGEFGVYLMMGMRRGRLFGMLLAEDLLVSALALLIGIPIAVLVSELTSLVTASVVGMGIIGHRFTFSASAAAITAVGFLVVKLAVSLVLSASVCRTEIGELLAKSSGNEKPGRHPAVYAASAVAGVAMLVAAYALAIKGSAWYQTRLMALTLLLGFLGTILLFFGLRAVVALLIKVGRADSKLRVFTMRQVQENVIRQSTSLAISSLLVLFALCCFGAGIGIAGSQQGQHVLDYTFGPTDYPDDPAVFYAKVERALEEGGVSERFSHMFPMSMGNVRTTEDYVDGGVFQMPAVMAALEALPPSQDRDVLLNNLQYADYPTLIRLSDYNRLLEVAGLPALTLAPDEAAVYMDPDLTDEKRVGMVSDILATRPQAMLDGDPLTLTGQVQTTNLVTDWFITHLFALIVPDERFEYYTTGKYGVYMDAVLDLSAGDASLMNAIAEVNDQLDALDLGAQNIEYESYLQTIGRQLFYMVAASYITIYLAVIFLVVANTVMGVQFLMNQRKTGHRYQTLVRLGATYQDLRASARRQINWFMGLPVGIAALSSIFGVRALFSGILSSRAQESLGQMLLVSVAMIALLCVVEFVYMTVIKRSSDRYLLTLMEPQMQE